MVVGSVVVTAASAAGSSDPPHDDATSSAANASALVEARRVRRCAHVSERIDIMSIMSRTHRLLQSIP